jgi:hypothetical protein
MPTHVEKSRGKTTTRYNVEGVIVHPDYVKGKLYNDFALVRLSEDAQFGPGTKVFCLKPDNDFTEGQIVVDADPVRILPKEECESKLSREFLDTELSNGLSDNQICISECQTRKLAVTPTNLPVSQLIGFLSYCTDEKTGTGIYTRISPYLDWIERTVWGPQMPIPVRGELITTTSTTTTTTVAPVFIPPSSNDNQGSGQSGQGLRISEKSKTDLGCET